MRKIHLFSVLVFLLMIAKVWGQDVDLQGGVEGSVSANSPDAVDESTVQGNGTKPGQNSTGANVNTFTGDAEAVATDFNYSRNGFPMKFERYFHNGISSPFGEMGQGWMSNYDICLFVPLPNSNGDHALLVMPNQTWRFSTLDGGNTFVTPPGCFYQLRNIGGIYVMADKTGIVYKFSVHGDGEPNIARLDEMDDLNGNKLTLTYEPSVFRWEEYQNFFGWPNGYGPDWCDLPPSFTWNDIETFQSLRLKTVSGTNNWSINFSYYDNTNSPDINFQQNYGNHYIANNNCSHQIYYDWVVTESSLNSQFSNRLKSVTNSAGDNIAFDSGGQMGPITQVLRSPSNLNASYQYYAYAAKPNSDFISNPEESSPTSIVTLKQVIDSRAPAGYRNLTYVSESDSSGINNPVRQIRNAMGQLMYSYDYSTDSSGDKLTSTSGPNGLIETDVYNSSGVWFQKRFVVDGHPYTESYTFNSDFLPNYVVDGNGNPTTMVYDSLGNLTYRQDGEGFYESGVYNNNIDYPTAITGATGFFYSRQLSSTDKNLVTKNYTYDANGNGGSNGNILQVSVAGVGIQVTNSYSFSSGSLTQKTVTDANNHSTIYNFDLNGNVSSIQEPNVGPPESLTNITTTFTYDANGRNLLNSKTDPLIQTTTYVYNANNFLASVQYPDVTSESYLYDGDGDRTQVTDRKTTTSTFSYDLADRLTDSYQAGTKHTHVQLDAVGNRISIFDNKVQKTSFVYNEQNKVRSTIDSVGVGYTNTYDGSLNVIASKDTRGVTKNFTFYKNNRLKMVRFSDGTSSVSYTYDGNGNRTTMVDGVGTKTYTYDALNRLLVIVDSARNYNLTYTYDPVGNRLSEQNNKVLGSIQYNYYENNQLKILTDVDGMGTTYVYDKLKNLQNVFYPNGTTGIYFYDYTNHTGRLTSLQTINSRQEIISSFSYVYDGVGNVTSTTDLTGSSTFLYDSLYQLTSVTHPGPQGVVGYGYDGVGNRVSFTQNGITQTFVNDSGNQLNSTSGPNGETFSFDAAGNMKTRSAGYTYSWDALNRLVKVLTPSGTISFVYDGDDHRIQKITPSGTTNYFYDGNSVVLETDGNGNTLKNFNSNISVKDKKGNKLFYLCNGHGDVAGFMDILQNLVTIYTYDSFGSTLGDKKDNNNKRYVGELDVYSDDDIGLEYMQHRWYDPKLGRFISRDPIGLKGGLNLYEYCSNNPLSLVDPNGHFWWLLIPIIAGAIGGAVDAITDPNWDGDLGSVLLEAGVGAIAGAASSFLAPAEAALAGLSALAQLGIVAQAAALASGIGNAVAQELFHHRLDLGELGVAMGIAATTATIGGGAALYLGAAVDSGIAVLTTGVGDILASIEQLKNSPGFKKN